MNAIGTDVKVAAQSILKQVVATPRSVPIVTPVAPKVQVTTKPLENGLYFNTTDEEEVNLDGCNCRYAADFEWLWDTSCSFTGVEY